jgi:putative molybdopterin biosynthesis protein
MSEELLNTKEAAEYLGVHEKQLYMLIKEKRIPATRVTGKWIFPRKLLDECIETDARRNLGKARERARKGEGVLLGAGSDDPVLALLAGELRRSNSPETVLFLASIGSTEGLRALNRGDVDLTFSHLLDPETGEYNLPFLPRLVPDRAVAAVNLVRREIGFVVAPGNPKRIRTFKDLGKKGLRIINRQPGSGTRVLLEQELAKAGVSSKTLAGWDRDATTHYEVALAVHAGEADVGIASASVAGLTGLGFVPLREERFDMVLDRGTFFERRFQSLLDRLASSAFRERVGRMGGYDFRDCGTVLTREP